jgi:acyl carrier protein
MAAGVVPREGEALLGEVSQVVAGIASVKPPYTGEEHLYNHLGVESIQALSLLLSLEERFGVSLDDQRFVKCTTVAALADLIGEARRPESGP